VDGRAVAVRSPMDAIRAGFAFVPEDRKAMGLVLSLSVADNIALASLGRLARRGLVDSVHVERTAMNRLRDLSIKVPVLGAELSGERITQLAIMQLAVGAAGRQEAAS